MLQRLIIALGLAALPPVAGCGYAVVGAALMGGDSGGGGAGVANTPAVAQIVEVPRGDATTQPVTISVSDAESDAVPVVLEYDVGGSGLQPATLVSIVRRSDRAVVATGPFAGATPPLASAPGGVLYDLIWDFGGDLGAGARAGASIRLSVPGAPTPPVTAGGLKIGNDAPVIANVQVDRNRGAVVVSFDLLDSTGDICDLRPRVLPVGAAAVTLTSVVGGRTIDLVASDVAGRFDFTWDTEAQLGRLDRTVAVELVAIDDAGAESTPATSAPVVLDNNDPPSIALSTPARSLTGLVEVRYRVIDREGDPVDVVVRRRGEGETVSATASEVTGGEGTLALGSSLIGTPHTFVWNAASDLGGLEARRVVISIDPIDAAGNPGLLQETDAFTVGNSAPVAVIATPASPLSLDVAVDFTLFDSSADLAAIDVRFSANGGPFLPATPESVTLTVGLATTLPGTPTAPANLVYVWSSADDLPGFDGDVQLEIVADDNLPGGQAAATRTAVFHLDNEGDLRPSVDVGTIVRTVSGTAVVPYTLLDPDPGDTASVIVAFSTDGASFTTATAHPVSPPVTGLATSETGIPYVFIWDYESQGGLGARRVFLRVTPFGADGQGTPDTSAATIVGNDAPDALNPAFGGTVVNGERSGTIPVSYALFDSTADPVDIIVEFSAGGAPFAPATTSVSQRTNLLSQNPAAPGTPFGHVFVWDSLSDPGSATFQGTVTIRLTPNDAFATGTAVVTSTAIDNNAPPVATIETPQRSVTGEVVVSFTLRDANGDAATVIPSFATADAGPPLSGPATIVAVDGVLGGLAGPLPASPAGTPHTIAWRYDAPADLGGNAARRVRFTIRAQDATGDRDVDAVSPVFTVGNDAPVATIAVDALVAGDVPVALTLFDSSADLANVTLEYQIAGASFTAATVKPPGGGGSALVNLATTAPGSATLPAQHTLVWESRTDLPDASLLPVALRLRATDAFGAASPFVPTATTLDNALPQTPPTVIADPDGTLAARQPGPAVDIPFRLVDAQSNPADVLVEYSTAALRGAFVPATRAAGATPTAALATTETGVDHVFRWDAAGDLDAAGTVDLRLTAIDTVGGGRSTATARAVVLNDPPMAAVADGPPPGASLVGFVPVMVVLADSTADLTQVAFEVVIRSAAGAILSTATATVPGAGTFLPTDAGDGIAYDFLWNTLVDLGGSNPDDVRLRIRATDDRGAAAAMLEIGPFTNLNGDRPVIAIGDIQRGPGPIAIALTLADAQSETVTAELSYSVNGGTVFHPLDDEHLAGGAAARMNLATAGTPAPTHVLTWNAPADILENRGLAGAVPIVFRVRASDLIGFGPFASAPAISGNDAPEVQSLVPDVPALMVVPFAIALEDTSADSVTLTVDWFDGSIFRPATIVAGGRASYETASPAGAVHRLAWNAGRDVVAAGMGPVPGPFPGLKLRVSADDFPLDVVAAVSRTSDPFTVFLTDEPVAIITSPLPGARVVPDLAGAVTVTYVIFDLASDTATATVAFEEPGAPTQTASAGPGSEGPEGLATSPEGVAHVFVWRVIDDIPSDRAGVTLTVSVVEDLSDPPFVAAAPNLEIDANAAPTVALDDIGGALAPFVDLVATVRDAESDEVDLEFRVSFDGGITFMDATVVPFPAGLPATPAGIRHRVSWALGEDLIRAGLATATQTSTVMEVTPSDGDGPLSRGPTFRVVIAAFDAAVVLRTPDPLASTVTVAPRSLPADLVSLANVTVTVIDVTGAPAPGHTVALQYGAAAVISAPGVTDANGVYQGFVRSNVPVVAGLTVTIDPGPREVVLDGGTIAFLEPNPGQITDLRAAYAGAANQLRLLWTATGSDGAIGTAASYILKTAATPITNEAQFNAPPPATTTITQSFVPLPSGSTEDRTIAQTWFVGTRHFALRAVDGTGALGPISNSLAVNLNASATFPPASTDFGSVGVDSFLDLPLVVSNTSSVVDLTITSTNRTGDGEFSIASGEVLAGSPVVLAPGASRAIVVRFLPTNLEAYTGNVAISFSPPTPPSTFNAALAGTGVPAGVNHPPTVPVADVSPRLVSPGALVTLTVNVRDLENVLPTTDTITSVTIDLSPVGGSATQPMTPGAVVDALTRTYTHVLDTTGRPAGAYALEVTATDGGGLTGKRRLLALVFTGNVHEVGPGRTHATIEAGIAAANPLGGDVVLIYDATYAGTGNRNLTIGKQVLIVSANGPAGAVVDLELGSPIGGYVFALVNSGETRSTAIVGLTLKRARDGAINMQATTGSVAPTIAGCRFEMNTADTFGGAVTMDGANVNPLFLDCVFLQNDRNGASGTSGRGGAVYSFAAQPVFDGCTFDRNSVKGDGGAMFLAGGAVQVSRSVFVQNTLVAASSGSGGAVSIAIVGAPLNPPLGNFTFTACVFDRNDANLAGGAGAGISSESGGGTTDANLFVTDSDFLGNLRGAINWRANSALTARGNLILTRCTFNGNTQQKAVFAVSRRFVASRCLFVGNTGGGIRLSGAALQAESEVADCTFIANTAIDSIGGGGVDFVNQAGTNLANAPRLLRSVFRANTASLTGGGGFVLSGGSAATVADCRFESNRTVAAALEGGGVFSAGTISLSGCVFRDNEATRGGGIALVSGQLITASVSRSLFDGNTALTRGGGIFCNYSNAGGSVTIASTTVSQNLATNAGSTGGGIAFEQGPATVVNCIVWGNDAATGDELAVASGHTQTISVTFCDVRNDPGDILDGGNSINPTQIPPSFVPPQNGNLSSDPLFVIGPDGDNFYLAGVSPCVDAGSATAASLGLDTFTTRSDHATDTGVVDLGYHRKP